MKRTVVSLDPEYLPWDGDVVKLLHKRHPWISILVSLALLLALGGYWGYRAYGQRAAQAIGAVLTNAGTAGVATPAPDSDNLPTPGGEIVTIPRRLVIIASGMALAGIILIIMGVRMRRSLLNKSGAT